MTVTVSIRYVIDRFRRDDFERYARNWLEIIPRCGGDLIGYFMPHEGTNNVALALIGFDSLAAYEAYRARLKADPAGAANFAAGRSPFVMMIALLEDGTLPDGTGVALTLRAG